MPPWWDTMGRCLTPELSVIIPAYNEGPAFGVRLERLVAYLHGRWRAEVVVVDDGSRDETLAQATRVASAHESVRLVALGRNRGKGAAVRAGVLEAAGEFVCFTDADLPVALDAFERAIALLRGSADVVIASRAVAGSVVATREAFPRWLLSRGFRAFVRRVFRLPYGDTQCGFKAFRREAARALFQRLQTEGFAFDVELLVLSRALGCSVVEIPVRIDNARLSTVSLLTHGGRVGRDLWRLARRFACRTPFSTG